MSRKQFSVNVMHKTSIVINDLGLGRLRLVLSTLLWQKSPKLPSPRDIFSTKLI